MTKYEAYQNIRVCDDAEAGFYAGWDSRQPEIDALTARAEAAEKKSRDVIEIFEKLQKYWASKITSRNGMYHIDYHVGIEAAIDAAINIP